MSMKQAKFYVAQYKDGSYFTYDSDLMPSETNDIKKAYGFESKVEAKKRTKGYGCSISFVSATYNIRPEAPKGLEIL